MTIGSPLQSSELKKAKSIVADMSVSRSFLL